MALVSQAEFARLHEVSRKQVTSWKAKGYLVLDGKKVDVEKSEENLKAKKLGRFKNVLPDSVTQPPIGNEGNKPVHDEFDAQISSSESLDEIEQKADEFIRRVLDGQFYKFAVAEGIKQNALAVKALLEARELSGSLVEFDVAKDILFTEHRKARDAWLKFPTNNAAIMAEELGVEVGHLTDVLTNYIQKQIEELGEPSVQFRAET